MNYFNPEILSKGELMQIKEWIEKPIVEYPEDSIFRRKLEEDLWDIDDVLERDAE